MTYKGHVENGTIVLDNPGLLPEGAEVVVKLSASTDEQSPEPKSHYERIQHLVGMFEDLPSDFAANHDHYIHGTPKRA